MPGVASGNIGYGSGQYPAQARGMRPPVAPVQPVAEPQKVTVGIMNRVLSVCATLLIISASMYAAANYFGDDISRGGHSVSFKPLEISIGEDRLSVPSNSVRFRYQRRPGTLEKLELYSHWPSLSGYSDDLKDEFNKGVASADLVFMTLERRTMTLDMSGRIGPIYKRFFVGEPENQPFGLVRQPLSSEDGFIDEDLYYAASSPYPFATRCVREASATATPFCIRDIHVGRDLMLTYRFHKRFLPQWIELDQALRAHVKSMITNL